MKVGHSDSLILTWRLAELEARQLKASTIEPTRLLLGLCKSLDLDLPALVPKDSPDRDGVLEELLREVRRLRRDAKNADVHAAQLMSQPRIRERIEELKAEASAKCSLSREAYIQSLVET